MTPIEILSNRISRKIQASVDMPDPEESIKIISSINLDDEALTCFGESKNIIKTFHSLFSGKTTNEDVSLLVCAGPSALAVEQTKLYLDISQTGSSFGAIVENMVYGDGSLKKNAVEKRLLLSEKLHAVNMAINALSELQQAVSEYKKF